MKAAIAIADLAARIARGDMSPDEPVFYVRASDVLGASIVSYYALNAYGVIPESKRQKLMKLANEMGDWRTANQTERTET